MIYKYRVWNGREMVSPDYITRNGIAFWREDSIQCSSPKIMQFTGRNDRGGQEIYEGDIIHFINPNNDTKGSRYHEGNLSVIWSNRHTAFLVTYNNWTEHNSMGNLGWWLHELLADIEVIGNIYATPELLES